MSNFPGNLYEALKSCFYFAHSLVKISLNYNDSFSLFVLHVFEYFLISLVFMVVHSLMKI